jgi:hypothetical protein
LKPIVRSGPTPGIWIAIGIAGFHYQAATALDYISLSWESSRMHSTLPMIDPIKCLTGNVCLPFACFFGIPAKAVNQGPASRLPPVQFRDRLRTPAGAGDDGKKMLVFEHHISGRLLTALRVAEQTCSRYFDWRVFYDLENSTGSAVAISPANWSRKRLNRDHV